ncbi:unnamed protein product [Closterium sp. NIES-65]|nr:unnamed protein product [Closterium sp. NIES-65]
MSCGRFSWYFPLPHIKPGTLISGPSPQYPPPPPFPPHAHSEEAAEQELPDELRKILLQSQADASNAPKRAFQGAAVRVAFGFGASAAAAAAAGMGMGPTKGGSSGFGDGGGGSFQLDEKKAKKRDTMDYSRYYPTTLPLRPPNTGPPDILNEAEFGEEALSRPFNEAAVPPARELGLNPPAAAAAAASSSSLDDRMVFFQLPAALPVRRERAAELAPGEPGPLDELSSLPEGRIGKILVYDDGRVKMRLGDTLFDLQAGSPCIFHQELAAVNAASGMCHFLGDVRQRAVVVPDIDSLLQ